MPTCGGESAFSFTRLSALEFFFGYSHGYAANAALPGPTTLHMRGATGSLHVRTRTPSVLVRDVLGPHLRIWN